MKHLGDITKIDWFAVEPVDVVTGGSPCQDLSIAGGRKGLAGDRSGLFMEQIRCVKELRQADVLRGRSGIAIRPRFMVWENVPGAFSSNKGEDFRAVLEETVRIIRAEAPDVPVPEGGWPRAGCLYDEMGQWSVAWRVHDAKFWGVPQRRKRIALVADFGGLCAPEVLFERKGLSGDFDPGQAAGEEAAGRTGRSACHAISFRARGGKGSLTQEERSGANNQYVLCLNDQGGSRISVTKDFCGTLRANAHGNEPIVARIMEFGSYIDDGTASTVKSRDYKGTGDFVVTAVDCRNMTENPTTNGTLQAKSSGGFSYNLQNVCRIGGYVRRYTPLEEERLQGYPDGWTDIGDWTDTKGRKHKLADTPRYKALGNSIALPFWMWLLKRISAQYGRDATLGSLFDGIGGFPLCWERINGQGSARWASEIEEFPIAVTKVRFPE